MIEELRWSSSGDSSLPGEADLSFCSCSNSVSILIVAVARDALLEMLYDEVKDGLLSLVITPRGDIQATSRFKISIGYVVCGGVVLSRVQKENEGNPNIKCHRSWFYCLLDALKVLLGMATPAVALTSAVFTAANGSIGAINAESLGTKWV